MTRPVSLICPVIATDTIELAKDSRIFRKQVLRNGSIDYQGRRLDFSPKYYKQLSQAFEEKAFDAVHLVFAPQNNSHSRDVERVRGQVIGFETTGDGLDAIVRASNDKAATLLRENPEIGVSLAIAQPLKRDDGKTWPAAIEHVLATINPRVNGLSPWESVELAAGDDRLVIDLSTYDFADDGAEGPDTGDTDSADDTQEDEMPDTPSPQLTQDEVTRMRAILAEIDTPVEDTGPTDAELEAIAAALLAEDDDTEQVADVANGEPVAVGLSHEAGEAIELANARADRVEIELAHMRAERDTERYNALVRTFAEDYGIPPYVTELAKPLLTGDHTVELSNGDDVNVGETVYNLMVELAKSRPVDLSTPVYDTDQATATAEDTKARQSWAAEYKQTHGL